MNKENCALKLVDEIHMTTIHTRQIQLTKTVTYQGALCYGFENFGLGSLHYDYVGLAGATDTMNEM